MLVEDRFVEGKGARETETYVVYEVAVACSRKASVCWRDNGAGEGGGRGTGSFCVALLKFIYSCQMLVTHFFFFFY